MANADSVPLTIVDIIYRQFIPPITMLQNAIDACPDDLWVSEADGIPIWQQAYHASFWLYAWARDWDTPCDKPCFHSEESLGLQPATTPVITREQLAEYLQSVREACLSYICTLTPETLLMPQEAFGKFNIPADRILSQIRHVQHHVGAIYGKISKHTDRPLEWVGFNE